MATKLTISCYVRHRNIYSHDKNCANERWRLENQSFCSWGCRITLQFFLCKWLEDKSINKARGESVNSEFCIPSKPYTFSIAFSSRFWTFSRRSNNRFSSSSRFRTFSRRSSSRFSSRCSNNKRFTFSISYTIFTTKWRRLWSEFASTRAQLSSIVERVS